MADVQLEHGHFRVANRLAEAILAAGFSGQQLAILFALMRLTYGWRRRSVRLTVEELSRYAGAARGADAKRVGGTFRAALKGLIDNHVVRAPSEKNQGRHAVTLWIEKDFEQWGNYAIAEARLSSMWATRVTSNDDAISEAEHGPATGQVEASNMARPRAKLEGDMAQHRATTWPSTGPLHGPASGQVNPVSASDSIGCEAGKTVKDSERQKETATAAAAAVGTSNENPTNGASLERVYAIGLVTSANNAVTARWGEQPNPYFHGTAGPLAVDLIAMGVELPVAQLAIESVCRSKRGAKPGGIEYFRNAIVEAHQANEQRGIDAANRRPRQGSGSPVPTAAVLNPAPAAKLPSAKLEEAYDSARARAAAQWGSDPANKARYSAIVNRIVSDNPTWSPRTRSAAIVIECAAIAGFPSFGAWCTAQEPIALKPPGGS